MPSLLLTLEQCSRLYPEYRRTLKQNRLTDAEEKRKDRNTKVISLLETGESVREITVQCGCSKETVRTIKDKYYGVTEKRRLRNQKIIELLKAGKHPRFIAAESGVSLPTVIKFRTRLWNAGIETLGISPDKCAGASL